jgi:hypothetical protein
VKVHLTAVFFVLTAFAVPPNTAHTDARSDYLGAMELATSGKNREAVDKLKAVAAAGADYADEALLEIGRICEEELFDGFCAKFAYEDMLGRFSGSRLLERATLHLEGLKPILPEHMDATLRYRRAVRDFSKDKNAALSKVLLILDVDPDMPEADQARYWVGESYRGMDEDVKATGIFNELVRRSPGSIWARKAEYSLGLMAQEKKDYISAVAKFTAASATSDTAMAAAAKQSAERAAVHLFRMRMANWAIDVVIVGWVLFAVVLFRRKISLSKLLGPLVETWVIAAGSVVMLAIIWVMCRQYFGWLAAMFGATAVTAQLSGVYLKNSRPGKAGAVAYAAAVLALASCIIYAAMVKAGLFGAIVHTVVYGVEKS